MLCDNIKTMHIECNKKNITYKLHVIGKLNNFELQGFIILEHV